MFVDGMYISEESLHQVSKLKNQWWVCIWFGMKVACIESQVCHRTRSITAMHNAVYTYIGD